MTPQLITVTPENIDKEGIFCLKNAKHPGYQSKRQWYLDNYPNGLRMNILKDDEGKLIGFIEFTPAEHAWRPVNAPDYLFIHCLWVYPNKFHGQGFGSELIQSVAEYASKLGRQGIAVMTSDGGWMTNKELFVKSGFELVDRKDRFELMVKKLDKNAPDPEFISWEKQLSKYQGWHLLYANQCPMHQKSAEDLAADAAESGIELNIHEITNSEEARQMPGGFGVYNLIHDGKMMQDHYVSKARFKNILKQEVQLGNSIE